MAQATAPILNSTERATPSHRHRVCLVRCCGSVSARYRTVAHNALVSCLGGEFSTFGLG